MDKIESEMKRDEKAINDIAEKLELVANTNMVTKVELLQKFVAKDVKKTRRSLLLVKCLLNMRKKYKILIKYSKVMNIIAVMIKSEMTY